VHVILVSAGLRELGYETRLVVGREGPREGNLLDLAAAREVDCQRVDALGREIRPWSDLRALWTLYRTMREYRPAIVHTHTAKAGVLGRLAAALARVPVVVHTYHGHVLHSYFDPVKTRLFGLIERVLGRTTDSLIAVSEAVKSDLVRLGVAPAGKIRVVPLGLELERLAGELPRGVLRAEAGIAVDAPLVGIVGRLVPIKDVGTFLAAAARIEVVRPQARFAIVGDGEERARLEAEAARLGLTHAVRFYGWRRDLEAVYGDLDVVVNCSRNEGTPVALIEALAAGRPVVATRVGGTPDVLGDGERGTLVPAEDPEALAAAVLEVLDHPEEARARTRQGRQYVLARHSVSRLLADLDGLYRQLLADRAAA
jgi:glycosyltransferase involved in cell wall biosynthesis